MTSEEYAHLWDAWMDKPSTKTTRRYYDGFKYNTIRRDRMYEKENIYEKELDDLELIYLKTLGKIKDDLEYVEQVMTPYMKRYVDIKEQISVLESKIKLLNAKRDTYGED